LLYLGSLGTWYMLKEMLDFYDELKAKSKELNNIKEFKFLFVTKDQRVLRLALKDRGYQSDEIIITSSSREDVPKYISLCNTSVFFIKPSFSKKASAATKMGEIMAMGRPVITNVGWGDMEPILNDTLAGVLVKSLDAQGYNQAAQELLNTKFNPAKIRQDAEKYFSLAQGIKKYAGIYSKLLSNH
ncbi:MAG: glycosyltransferase, partial [Cyclobacteriaceae bacterium]|nr:glycosyltransferase [Cyclobacteriaceae bacterium]